MTQIKATLTDSMGSDLSVVNAARVSFGKKSDGVLAWKQETEDMTSPVRVPTEGDEKLIRYLAKHNHISPFGHCFASFHVKAPVFVARQLVKHKFLRWNEISRRYVDEEPEFYMPDVWRGRSQDKKQGSGEHTIDLCSILDVVTYGKETYDTVKEMYPTEEYLRSWESGLDNDLGNILYRYRQMIEFGVAPEQARMVLPQSTMTEWWWSGSLDAFASMCKLRCATDTQYETRIVADQISSVMGDLFPVSWGALMDD
jgi:thymidylate synthase (FAD)